MKLNNVKTKLEDLEYLLRLEKEKLEILNQQQKETLSEISKLEESEEYLQDVLWDSTASEDEKVGFYLGKENTLSKSKLRKIRKYQRKLA